MHLLNLCLGVIQIDTRAGDKKRFLATAPNDRKLFSDAGERCLGHTDNRHLAPHGVKEVFAKSRSIFSIQEDVAVDQNQLGVQGEFFQKVLNTWKLALIEMPRLIVHRGRQVTQECLSWRRIAPRVQGDPGSRAAIARVMNIDGKNHD